MMLQQVTLFICIFVRGVSSGETPTRIAGSEDKYMCGFARYCQIPLQKGCTDFHCRQQYVCIPVSQSHTTKMC